MAQLFLECLHSEFSMRIRRFIRMHFSEWKKCIEKTHELDARAGQSFHFAFINYINIWKLTFPIWLRSDRDTEHVENFLWNVCLNSFEIRYSSWAFHATPLLLPFVCVTCVSFTRQLSLSHFSFNHDRCAHVHVSCYYYCFRQFVPIIFLAVFQCIYKTYRFGIQWLLRRRDFDCLSFACLVFSLINCAEFHLIYVQEYSAHINAMIVFMSLRSFGACVFVSFLLLCGLVFVQNGSGEYPNMKSPSSFFTTRNEFLRKDLYDHAIDGQHQFEFSDRLTQSGMHTHTLRTTNPNF